MSGRYPDIGSVYQKNKKALDFVYWENSQRYSIVHSEIRKVIESLIEEESALERDRDEAQKIRFGVREWDTPALLTAKNWTPSNRILLFELWNYQNRLDLYLFLGPGPEETRQRILETIRRAPDVFSQPRSLRRSGKWIRVFHRSLLRQEAYENLEHEEREKEIHRQWRRFLGEDLPRITAALRKADWI